MSKNKKNRSTAKNSNSKKYAAKTQNTPKKKKTVPSNTEPESKKAAIGAKAVQKAEKPQKAAEKKSKESAALPKKDNVSADMSGKTKVAAKKPKINIKASKIKKKALVNKERFNYDTAIRQPGKKLLHKSKKIIFSENPVFVKAIAIVPILGAGVSLKNGLALSAAMFITVVLLNLIMYPLYRHIPHGFRFAASFVVSGVIITPVIILANYFVPNITAVYGIYLPLIAICSLPMIEKSYYGKKHGFLKTTAAAVLDGIGFAFAAVIVSIIREIIGNGTLYGRSMPYFSQMKFSFALLPAGAFLLIGLMIALFRKIFDKSESDINSKS
jgi:electron transport complex protein RnfE